MRILAEDIVYSLVEREVNALQVHFLCIEIRMLNYHVNNAMRVSDQLHFTNTNN